MDANKSGLVRRFEASASRAPNSIDRVHLGDFAFGVRRHPFWREYVDGWEPETWHFYETYCKPGAVVLDIGSWIGPTVLFAVAAGAGRIIAVDGNTDTVAHLEATRAANPALLSNLSIVNAVIDNRVGEVNFGQPGGSRAVSSASSVRGTGFRVRTTTIQDIMRDQGCDKADVVKIDIEGSEIDIVSQWSSLRSPMLLSLHPPFWSDRNLAECAATIVDGLARFDLQKSDGIELPKDELHKMLMSDDTHPSWGTSFGNFFEIAALPR